MEYKNHVTNNDRWIVEHIFLNENGKYFIEAGACNGIEESSCYVLEKYLQWTGICIEPNEEYFQELVKNRPQSICENVCLSHNNEKVIYLEGKVSQVHPMLGGIKSNLIKYRIDYQDIVSKGKEVTKNAITLAELLKKHHAPQVIHYLAMDIEGSELPVLEQFPFENYSILAISIEGEQCNDLLVSKGYVIVKNPFNRDKLFEKYFLHESIAGQKQVEISAEYYISLGNNLRRSNKVAEAFAAYQKAIAMEPHNFFFYFYLGNYQEEQGDLDTALFNYQKAIAITQDPPTWLYGNLGNVLQLQGRLDEAIKVYQQAIASTNDPPNWIYQNIDHIVQQQTILKNQQLPQSQPHELTPKVSVIIPTYNSALYLGEAIDSVLNQTYTNYEIIVIDDGSTDHTVELLEPYQDKVHYFYQENQGVSAARNQGIALAKGELIAFLDADDIFMPHKLEKQVAVFEEQSDLGIVNSGYRLIRENGEFITDIKRWETIPKLTIETWILHQPVLPSAMMFRKEWLEKVNGFDTRWFSSEDVDLVFRLISRGCRGVWLPEVTIYYRRHDLSATWENSLKQARNSEAMQANFFDCQDLPESISRLKQQFRFHNFTWLAWLCYQGGFTKEMAEYLQVSQSYSYFSWAETIVRWINLFKNCTELYGYTFDAYSFSKLPEWQAIVARLQTSPLFNQYYQKIAKYQQLVAVSPDNYHNSLTAKNYYYLGRNLLEQKDIDQAIIWLRKAIDLEPNNACYNSELGKALEARYDLEDAITQYQKTLRLEPHNQEFTHNLYRALKARKKWQELTQYCQEVSQKTLPKNILKLLIIFPYPPYPSAKGGLAMRMFEQIKYFGKKHHLTVVSFIFNEADYFIEQELQPYCDRAFMIKLGHPMSPNLGNKCQHLYHLKTWNMWKTLQQLSQVNFDLVFFDIIVSSSYYSLFSDRFTILQEHNIESKLLRNCQEFYNKELINNLATEIDAIQPFVNAESEYFKLETFENQMWQKFSLRTVVSLTNKQELDRRCNYGETLVVKNGIDTHSIKLINNKQSHKILYMGVMSYYPNIDGVLYFVEQIFPLIQQQDDSLCFCIAGREPPTIIQELAISHPNVEVIANPEDMNLVAQECIMSVVPLRLGSGTRIKILHAMAMGLPVVSTTVGYEGLEMIDGEHLLIRDQPEDFATAILQIYQDQNLWLKLRENGRQLVEKEYDWHQIFTQYEQEILSRITPKK
ncbi:MAG: glycosyltransferase [Xenococcus sp. (in: cyanobacteria)]